MNHTNKQDQRPAFQFYPKDWLSDTGLRCCSPAARGLWIDMLCIMWSSPKRGSLLTPANMQIACKSLQNLTCISSANDVQKYLDELEEHGVFSRLDDGTIINRRMYFQAQRENDISEKRRIAACKSHAKRKQKPHAKPAAPTPTALPSASPTAKTKTKPFVYECDLFKIDAKTHKRYTDAFPDVDLLAHYKKMAAWLVSHPRKYGQIMVFVYEWLQKEQGSKTAFVEIGKALGGAKGMPTEAYRPPRNQAKPPETLQERCERKVREEAE